MDAYGQLISRRKRQDRLFQVVGLACVLIGFGTLVALLVNLAADGLRRIDWAFLTSPPSRSAAASGILPAIVGTLFVILVTAVAAVPLGVAAGVYLEEYARKNWLTNLIEINISNLAGVPSIIYGLLGLGVFVYVFGLSHGVTVQLPAWLGWINPDPFFIRVPGLGRSILTAGLTLAFLILPIVIVATREALLAIPKGIREAAYALGSTRWQVVWHHLLPYSSGGIATGIIIALSRAIGETAPLIVVGAVAYIRFLPDSPIKAEPPFVSFDWLFEEFTVLPIQMFNWVSEARTAFHANAAATGLVLITITLLLNAVAIVVRYRVRRRIKW